MNWKDIGCEMALENSEVSPVLLFVAVAVIQTFAGRGQLEG